MQRETDGIIFRQVRTAAGRTMLLMFSQRFGKISVGTSISDKNTKSKSSLAIRPFTYGRYELYQGRDAYNLNFGEVKKSYYSFGEDLDKYITASYGLELTEKLLQEEVPEPRIFSLLLDFLNALERRAKSFDTILIAYEIKLLGILGLMPAMEECAICGDKNPTYFSVADGGMICENCHKDHEENIADRHIKRLIYHPGFDIVDTFRYFVEKPISAFEKIALDDEKSVEIQRILRDYMEYHMELGPLKTEAMIQG